MAQKKNLCKQKPIWIGQHPVQQIESNSEELHKMKEQEQGS